MFRIYVETNLIDASNEGNMKRKIPCQLEFYLPWSNEFNVVLDRKTSKGCYKPQELACWRW